MMRLAPKVLVKMQSEAGFSISSLDFQYAIRMIDVPGFTTVPGCKSG